jgi:hypothetical protein
MNQLPEAEELVLACLKPKAPPFHRFIVRQKLLDNDWQVGDRVVIYEITGSRPAGRVRVTAGTVITFAEPEG